MNGEFVTPVLIVFKATILLGLAIYVIFAAIIVRQEQRMASVLEESFEPVLKSISFLHLVLSVAVFFMALVFLPT